MATSESQQLIDRLTGDLSPYQHKIYHQPINKMTDYFVQFERGELHITTSNYLSSYLDDILLTCLVELKQAVENQIHNEYQAFKEFSESIAKAETKAQIRQCIIHFDQALGCDDERVKEDKKALDRHFDEQAITERYLRQYYKHCTQYQFILGRLNWLLMQYMPVLGGTSQHQLLQYSGMHTSLLHILQGEYYEWLKSQACLALKDLQPFIPQDSETLQIISKTLPETIKPERPLYFIDSALICLSQWDKKQYERWSKYIIIQDEAFDIFTRRQVLESHLSHYQDDNRLYKKVTEMEHPHIRQGLAKQINDINPKQRHKFFHKLIVDDDNSKVKAQALLSFADLVTSDRQNWRWQTVQSLADVINSREKHFTLRAALRSVQNVLITLFNHGYLAPNDQMCQSIMDNIIETKNNHESIAVRRLCGHTLEIIWAYQNVERYHIKSALAEQLQTAPLNQKQYLPEKLRVSCDKRTLGRLLSSCVHKDWNLDVTYVPGRKVSFYRGVRLRRKLWRFMHEMLFPFSEKNTDKLHTTARYFTGNMRIPSTILYDVTQTSVPGEPTRIPEENSWRPYLPLVDDITIYLLRHKWQRIELYSPEGITTIELPKTFLSRLWARVKLAFNAKHFMRLREIRPEKENMPANRYVKSLKDKLGVNVNFEHHQYDNSNTKVEDQSVTRFFNPAGLLLPLQHIFEGYAQYFTSIYANTNGQLLTVVLGALGVMIVGRYRKLKQVRKLHSANSMVIGSWGTRGKSGTERLKAALFNHAGWSLISKTSGSEPNLLFSNYTHQFDEIVLYRSYDQSTINEQLDIIPFITQLDPQIFLWECMAIQPHFADIIQQYWMNDDFTTITNTYPDHEDFQGPRGLDVANSLAHVIPPKGIAITTENVMLPVLAHFAEHRNSELVHVDEIKQELLTDEAVSAFKYYAHPHNLALSLELARHMGIEPNTALQGMAKNTEPDIGDFRIYYKAPIKKRQLQLVNAFSANDRYSSELSLERAGFYEQDMVKDPKTWSIIMVNNRSDRVLRSQVFGDLIARELSADRYMITNDQPWNYYRRIKRMYYRYLENTWQYLNEDAAQVVEKLARQLRLCLSEDEFLNRFQPTLAFLTNQDAIDREKLDTTMDKLKDDQTDDVYNKKLVDLVTYEYQAMRQYQKLQQNVSDRGAKSISKQSFCENFVHWFDNKFIIVGKKGVMGDELNLTIVQNTPIEHLGKVYGVANIKGPGLAMVHSWNYWDNCYMACDNALSDNEQQIEAGLKYLADQRNYNILGTNYIEKTKSRFEQSNSAKQYQKYLDRIDEILQQSGIDYVVGTQVSIWRRMLTYLVTLLEQIIEPADSIRRRKKADQIYRDLINERISFKQARTELNRLVVRQKSGWLSKRIFS